MRMRIPSGIMEDVKLRVYNPVNVCATVWASFLLMFRLLCYYTSFLNTS